MSGRVKYNVVVSGKSVLLKQIGWNHQFNFNLDSANKHFDKRFNLNHKIVKLDYCIALIVYFYQPRKSSNGE